MVQLSYRWEDLSFCLENSAFLNLKSLYWTYQASSLICCFTRYVYILIYFSQSFSLATRKDFKTMKLPLLIPSSWKPLERLEQT